MNEGLAEWGVFPSCGGFVVSHTTAKFQNVTAPKREQTIKTRIGTIETRHRLPRGSPQVDCAVERMGHEQTAANTRRASCSKIERTGHAKTGNGRIAHRNNADDRAKDEHDEAGTAAP